MVAYLRAVKLTSQESTYIVYGICIEVCSGRDVLCRLMVSHSEKLTFEMSVTMRLQ